MKPNFYRVLLPDEPEGGFVPRPDMSTPHWALDDFKNEFGAYVDEVAFRSGVRQSLAKVNTSVYASGPVYDFSMPSLVPVASTRMASKIEQLCGPSIHRIPLVVANYPHSVEIINVLDVLDCLDEERSKFMRYPKNFGAKAGKIGALIEIVIKSPLPLMSHAFRLKA